MCNSHHTSDGLKLKWALWVLQVTASSVITATCYVPLWSQTRNTVVLPGVKPGILCACLMSNPVYSVPVWSQTWNSLCLPGVKPGILCACLESNPEYCGPAWSKTRFTLLPGSQTLYTLPAWNQTRYTLCLPIVKPSFETPGLVTILTELPAPLLCI
jgi:hypothetical protein